MFTAAPWLRPEDADGLLVPTLPNSGIAPTQDLAHYRATGLLTADSTCSRYAAQQHNQLQTLQSRVTEAGAQEDQATLRDDFALINGPQGAPADMDKELRQGSKQGERVVLPDTPLPSAFDAAMEMMEEPHSAAAKSR